MMFTRNLATLFLCGAFFSCQSQKQEVIHKKEISIVFDGEKDTQKEVLHQSYKRIDWDLTSKEFVTAANEVSGLKLEDRVLIVYEKNGFLCSKFFDVEASTWGEENEILSPADFAVSTPSLVKMKSGLLVCAYSEQPFEDFKSQHFTIKVMTSKDGVDWSEPVLAYKAGNNFKTACWNPTIVEQPNGTLNVFFADEFPYGSGMEQNISRVKSSDDGKTWGEVEPILFRPGNRDASPFAVKINGSIRLALVRLTDTKKPDVSPKVEMVSLDKYFTPGEKLARWKPFIRSLDFDVTINSPKISLLDSGDSLLSVEIDEGRKDSLEMAVYVGDKESKNYSEKSLPFGEGFKGTIKNGFTVQLKGDKIMAFGVTDIAGEKGLWSVEGILKK
ncbi:MAG: glycoside hydrolase [Lentisphaeraceae bacterium]|nr:glycoside hydrolase [Lentisphaeraceae bacterium]